MKLIRKIGAACVIALGMWGVFSSIQNWSGDDAIFHMLVSLVAITVGVGYLVPEKLLASYEEQVADDAPPPEEPPASSATDTSDEQSEASIMVLRHHSNDGLEKLELLLRADERVLSMGHDEGRYYSVPDGDDLPEWYTLHVGCKAQDQDELAEDVTALIDKNFSKETASELDVRKL